MENNSLKCECLEDIIGFMSCSNRILVYGTGHYYALLALFIELNDVKKKIACLTTSDTDVPNEIDGYPVLSLNDIHCSEIDSVIIAITPSNSKGIRERLSQYGFSNIFQMEPKDRDIFLAYFRKLQIKKNKVLFDSYNGMGYRCNTKYVAEYIRKHNLPIEMVWRVSDEYDVEVPEGIRTVKMNSKDYFRDLYTSAFIVTNVCFNRVRPEQYVIWMWHGTGPFKKAGAAAYERTEENERKFRKAYSGVDLCVSNSADNTKMFREDFYHEGEIGEWGSPRVDILLSPGNTTKLMREKFGLRCDQKVLLYVPTFREDIDSSILSYDLDFSPILEELNNRFGGKFVLMYRLHHWLHDSSKSKGFSLDGIDVTQYEDTQELLILADVLITDYSSIMWDFSLMGKPVFLYQNDLDKYINDRGFYWDPKEWPYLKGYTQDDMIDIIKTFDQDVYKKKLDAFFRKDPSYDDGHACERVVDRIMDVIEHPWKYK